MSLRQSRNEANTWAPGHRCVGTANDFDFCRCNLPTVVSPVDCLSGVARRGLGHAPARLPHPDSRGSFESLISPAPDATLWSHLDQPSIRRGNSSHPPGALPGPGGTRLGQRDLSASRLEFRLTSSRIVRSSVPAAGGQSTEISSGAPPPSSRWKGCGSNRQRNARGPFFTCRSQAP